MLQPAYLFRSQSDTLVLGVEFIDFSADAGLPQALHGIGKNRLDGFLIEFLFDEFPEDFRNQPFGRRPSKRPQHNAEAFAHQAAFGHRRDQGVQRVGFGMVIGDQVGW